jgi:hypothetical protein
MARAVPAVLGALCVLGALGQVPEAEATTRVSTIYSALAAQDAASLLAEMGFQATNTPLPEGSQKYAFAMGTYNVSLFLLDCEGGLCEDLQMFAGFKTSRVSADLINQWNRDYRLSRAYVSDEGAGVIEADLSLQGGVTLDEVMNFITLFRSSSAKFAEHIGFR